MVIGNKIFENTNLGRMFYLRLKFGFIFIVSILFLISGCSSIENSKESTGKSKHNMSMMGMEETSSKNELPTFLSDKQDQVKNLYLAVADNKKLLEQMPCYCGCGESVGHSNNYDCFVNENKKTGAVVWDQHGVNCDVCMEIAAQSISDYQNGKSIHDIRKYIDQKYEEGYAKPTPTPTPQV